VWQQRWETTRARGEQRWRQPCGLVTASYAGSLLRPYKHDELSRTSVPLWQKHFCGSVDEVEEVFDELPRDPPDVVIFEVVVVDVAHRAVGHASVLDLENVRIL